MVKFLVYKWCPVSWQVRNLNSQSPDYCVIIPPSAGVVNKARQCPGGHLSSKISWDYVDGGATLSSSGIQGKLLSLHTFPKGRPRTLFGDSMCHLGILLGPLYWLTANNQYPLSGDQTKGFIGKLFSELWYAIYIWNLTTLMINLSNMFLWFCWVEPLTKGSASTQKHLLGFWLITSMSLLWDMSLLENSYLMASLLLLKCMPDPRGLMTF